MAHVVGYRVTRMQMRPSVSETGESAPLIVPSVPSGAHSDANWPIDCNRSMAETAPLFLI